MTETNNDAIRRELVRTFDKPCAICKGPATGYHYETASCNGCKTFFRRSVLSGKTYKCIKGNNNCLEKCEAFQRIKCRKCRLSKCIEQGMNPKAVTCAGGPARCSAEKSPTPGTSSSSHTPIQQESSLPSTSIPQELWLNSAIEIIKICDFYERMLHSRTLPINPYSFDLNIDTFLQRPSLLLQIDKNTISLLPGIIVFPQGRSWSELFSLDIFLIVEYAKLLDHFKILIPNDQKSLLLCSAFAMVVAMQALDSFHRGCDSISLPGGASPLLSLPQFSNLGALSRHHRDVFVEILAPLRRESIDKQEAALLLPIMLFQNVAFNLSPCGSQTCVPLALSYHMKMLFMYLRQKTDAQSASTRFASLLAVTQHFFAFAKKNCLHIVSENGDISKSQEDLISKIIYGNCPQELSFYNQMMHLPVRIL